MALRDALLTAFTTSARTRGLCRWEIAHDTAAFAVASIRRWWVTMGGERHPREWTLLVAADGGASNGSWVRLWKVELQKFADETGLTLKFCHFPPGMSNWNKPPEGFRPRRLRLILHGLLVALCVF